MYANQPSPVRKLCGFAVWASRMIPKLSLNGSKSMILSYRTRNFFLTEKYRCLVVNRWKMFQTRWPGPGPKLKPRWDVHMAGGGDRYEGYAGAPLLLIAGWSGSGA